MWNDYSKSYIKNNPSSSLSVRVAAFISALLLSLLCGLFYNFWKYEIERIHFEEGGWHSRIVGEIDSEDLAFIQHFASVKKAEINQDLSYGQEITADIYFQDIRKVLKDMPQISERLKMEPEAIIYHHSLLSMYLVRDPQDTAPRLIFPFFLAVTVMSCLSLVIMIHNSFAVSMNARIHQFGIFSSIGATPKQIRTCLLQEAAILCIIPILIGNLVGIVISKGIIILINIIAADVPGRLESVWGYSPYIFIITLFLSAATMWISAWIPARKMSRLTPLEAIRQTGELQLKKKSNPGILAHVFGIEGELAENARKAQKKALRTATLSLTCSFLAFSLSQCFFTLSKISQRMTYFERYQNVWDIMVTLKNINIDEFAEANALEELPGVRSSIAYQKAAAKRKITEEDFSQELKTMGGLHNAPETYVSSYDDGWLVNVPIIIMDDASFLEYCRQIGASPRLNGAVILNRIQDISNPDFRHREYFPYINENQSSTTLQQAGKEENTAEIPVLSYTNQVPVLREAYGELDYYVLVHFLPVSLWKEIKEQIGGMETDSYVRILAKEGVTLEELNNLEENVIQFLKSKDTLSDKISLPHKEDSQTYLLAQSPDSDTLGKNTLYTKYEIESENRIEEKLINDDMINGMLMIIEGFCVLLAVIGISNVFSNTLGFIYQRKREFARYLSIGLTPDGIRKMFCIEAFITAGSPILITLPITALAAAFMIKASYLEPEIFIREMPVLPIMIFIFAVFGAVALAYYLGARKMLGSNLTEALWNDTMM